MNSVLYNVLAPFDWALPSAITAALLALIPGAVAAAKGRRAFVITWRIAAAVLFVFYVINAAAVELWHAPGEPAMALRIMAGLAK